jgi:hypothetical protein
VNLIFFTLKAKFCHSIKNNKKFINFGPKNKKRHDKEEIFFKIYKIKIITIFNENDENIDEFSQLPMSM